jgi:lysozyme
MAGESPTSKPQATLEQIEKIIEPYKSRLKKSDQVILVGVRAYYRDSMGTTGRNDYGMYDDALFWVAPSALGAYNANTDPSRLGWNPNAQKFMARLRAGCWRYIEWKHKQQYWAFGQGSNKVAVDRVKEDGTVAKTETGVFGINVHRGGSKGTSSEGCVTLVPNQWEQFKDQGYYLLDRFDQDEFPFILDTREDAE